MAVSVDDRERQQMMIDRVAEEYGVTVESTLLTDEDHRVIDRYGLFNPDEPRSRPVPHPAVFVIDRDGVVRWKFVETDYKVRAEPDDLLDAIHGLRREAGPP